MEFFSLTIHENLFRKQKLLANRLCQIVQTLNQNTSEITFTIYCAKNNHCVILLFIVTCCCLTMELFLFFGLRLTVECFNELDTIFALMY